MTGARATVAGVLLALVFTWSVLRLFGVQFSAGGFYPSYSSLRADPQGTKLLFDSLSRLPGLQVGRNYLPLEYFKGNRAAVLLLGIPTEELNPALLDRIEKLARNGNRVLLALAFRETGRNADQDPLEHAWHIRLSMDDRKRRYPLSFTDTGPWTIREQAGTKILVVERSFGAGSVWLFAESGEFSNETVLAGRLDPVIMALGPSTQVVFDEQHFGISESGSVVALARQFRLTGLGFGLFLVAALALWRNTSAFPPLRQSPALDQYTGRTSFEGLVTLLQRHVRPRQLATACWEEWLKANRHQSPADRLQKGAAIAAAGAQDPLEAVRELQAGLHAKGEL
jgi:hypothetical protein